MIRIVADFQNIGQTNGAWNDSFTAYGAMNLSVISVRSSDNRASVTGS